MVRFNVTRSEVVGNCVN